jgi:hypothetical protein
MRGFKNYKNVITICGDGRNVGKTFLGESIISQFSQNNTIIAIKISKFKHRKEDKIGLIKIFKEANLAIFKEQYFTQKDSGRYLKAGATASYYIECNDDSLLKAFLYVYNLHKNTCLFVCESASLTNYISPQFSIFVASKDYDTEKNKLCYFNKSNLVLKEKSIEIAMPQLFLLAANNKWQLKYSKAHYSYV